MGDRSTAMQVMEKSRSSTGTASCGSFFWVVLPCTEYAEKKVSAMFFVDHLPRGFGLPVWSSAVSGSGLVEKEKVIEEISCSCTPYSVETVRNSGTYFDSI
jgi:hypothetical protein